MIIKKGPKFFYSIVSMNITIVIKCFLEINSFERIEEAFVPKSKCDYMNGSYLNVNKSIFLSFSQGFTVKLVKEENFLLKIFLKVVNLMV